MVLTMMSVFNGIVEDVDLLIFQPSRLAPFHQGWHLFLPCDSRHISPRLQLEPLTAREKSVLVLRCQGLEGVLWQYGRYDNMKHVVTNIEYL